MLQKRMKLLKNQAGLTLVELLAVIVILGVIAAIAVPTIGGLVKDTKVKADAQSAVLIQEAAERMALITVSNPADGAVQTYTVDQLVSGGYLKTAPARQQGGTFTQVTVTYEADNGAWTAGAVTTNP